MLLVMAGGCQGRIDAPSLAKRPVERQPLLDPAQASEPEAALDPALGKRLSAIVAEARQGETAFASAREAADAAIGKASGRGEGGEEWIAAQQAISALEAARGPIQAQLTAIEELRADPVNASAGNRAAVDAAAATVESIGTAQAGTVQALDGRLR